MMPNDNSCAVLPSGRDNVGRLFDSLQDDTKIRTTPENVE